MLSLKKFLIMDTTNQRQNSDLQSRNNRVPENLRNLPQDQWNQISPEGRDFYNNLFNTATQRREEFLQGTNFPQEYREQLNSVLNRVTQELSLEAARTYEQYVPAGQH